MSFNIAKPALSVGRMGIASSSRLGLAPVGMNARAVLIASRGISSSRPNGVSSTSSTKAAAIARDESISRDDTAGFKYTLGGPILPGTVNDATPFPPSNATEGSTHWKFERGLSAALIPIMAGAAVSGSGTGMYPYVDAALASTLIIHTHLGFDNCLTDYFHPTKYPKLGPVFVWALRIGTGAALWGVYEFNTNDVGLTETIRQAWKA